MFGPFVQGLAQLFVRQAVILIQEHQGNDPNTQLVPSNAAGSGWSKPEEPQPQPQPQPEIRQSALTAGSTWASQNRSDTTGWVPPTREGPYAAAGKGSGKGSFPVDRHLNPEEYPSLAAVSREKPQVRRHEQHAAHQQVRNTWRAADAGVSTVTASRQLSSCSTADSVLCWSPA